LLLLTPISHAQLSRLVLTTIQPTPTITAVLTLLDHSLQCTWVIWVTGTALVESFHSPSMHEKRERKLEEENKRQDVM
jgi:hypothetical protein